MSIMTRATKLRNMTWDAFTQSLADDQVVRLDMREMLTMAAGERAASYDGLQVRATRIR